MFFFATIFILMCMLLKLLCQVLYSIPITIQNAKSEKDNGQTVRDTMAI